MTDWLFYVLLALLLLAWAVISVLHWRWKRRNLAQLRKELTEEEQSHAP